MTNVEYLFGAYAIAILGLAGYVFYLRRQRARVAADLAAEGETPEPD